jgi:hypothetical protein
MSHAVVGNECNWLCNEWSVRFLKNEKHVLEELKSSPERDKENRPKSEFNLKVLNIRNVSKQAKRI